MKSKAILIFIVISILAFASCSDRKATVEAIAPPFYKTEINLMFDAEGDTLKSDIDTMYSERFSRFLVKDTVLLNAVRKNLLAGLLQ